MKTVTSAVLVAAVGGLISFAVGCNRQTDSGVLDDGTAALACADQDTFSDCSTEQMQAYLASFETQVSQDTQQVGTLQSEETAAVPATDPATDPAAATTLDPTGDGSGAPASGASTLALDDTNVADLEMQKLQKEIDLLSKQIDLLQKKIDLLKGKLGTSTGTGTGTGTGTVTVNGLVACVGFANDGTVSSCVDQNPTYITQAQCEAPGAAGITWKRQSGKLCSAFPIGKKPPTAVAPLAPVAAAPACGAASETTTDGSTIWQWCVVRDGNGKLIDQYYWMNQCNYTGGTVQFSCPAGQQLGDCLLGQARAAKKCQ